MFIHLVKTRKDVTAQIIPKASSETTLASQAQSLKELLANYQRVESYLIEIRDAQDDTVKADILDRLGSEADVLSAKKIIMKSIFTMHQTLGEKTLEAMQSQQLLTQQEQDLMTMVQRQISLSDINQSREKGDLIR